MRLLGFHRGPALRPFGKSISEMKRLYVRHKFQGCGIGRALATAVLRKASVLEYQKLRLDTVPSMKAAIQMYRSMGFYPIPSYRQNPISRCVGQGNERLHRG